MCSLENSKVNLEMLSGELIKDDRTVSLSSGAECCHVITQNSVSCLLLVLADVFELHVLYSIVPSASGHSHPHH